MPTEGSSLTTVIPCLNKLNVQNKRLLEYVESVSENVKKYVPIVSSESDGVSVAVTQQQQNIESVNNRLEKIELNINADILVCRGGWGGGQWMT